MLHIPISKDQELLQVYEFTQVPQPLTASLFVSFDPDHNMLAVSDDQRQFRTFQKEDLTLCRQSDLLHWCDGPTVTRFRESMTGLDSSECLMHLFLQEHESANNTCHTSVSGPINAALPLADGTILTASTTDQQIPVMCPGNKVHYERVSHVTRLRLDPGCRATAAGWAVHQPFDASGEAETASYSWETSALQDTLDLVMAMTNGSTDDLDLGAALEIRELHDVSGARRARPHTNCDGVSTLRIVIIAGLTILGVACASLFGLSIWRRYAVQAKITAAKDWTLAQIQKAVDTVYLFPRALSVRGPSAPPAVPGFNLA
jgi:hypothetical protein